MLKTFYLLLCVFDKNTLWYTAGYDYMAKIAEI